MKRLLSLVLMLSSTTLFAVSFDIIGPCSEKPVYQGSFKTDLAESVGVITIGLLDFYKIPYIGSAEGLNSIINTPVGLGSIEVISDTKMRAYGWCFSVNDVMPDVMPHQLHFSSQNDHLSWFYAYSTYDQGQWLDYCVPSFHIKAAQFCKK